VLIAWENEALLAARELGKDKLEIILPSSSILAEPPVAMVDKIAGRTAPRRWRRPISSSSTRRRDRRSSRGITSGLGSRRWRTSTPRSSRR